MFLTLKRITKIAIILFCGIVFVVAGPGTKNWKKCELDSDCAEGQLCRLICNRTCVPKCITLLPDKIDPLLQVVTSSESPFLQGELNPFAAVLRDAAAIATPLTISEAELEAELAEGDEIPPTAPSIAITTVTEPTPPPSTTFVTFPTLISTSTDGEDIFPPSTEPQSPGFGYDHESGYTATSTFGEDDTTTSAVTPETEGTENTTSVTEASSTVSENSDNTENDEKSSLGVDPHGFSTQHLTTTVDPFPETDPFSPVDLSPEADQTTPSTSTEDSIENSTLLTPPEATTFIVSDADSDFSSDSDETLADDTSTSASQSTTIIPGIPPAPPLDGCPAPEVCGKNCGIYIDENGCQSCQCLWLPISCEENSDCIEEGQFCDLGRCECMPGFIQDMLQSGICKHLTDDDLQNVAGVKGASLLIDGKKKESTGYRRARRDQTAQKPNRAERLQWPGPCDRDAQCPPGLFCIQGDCWHLPDKPIKNIAFSDDTAPKSFAVGLDTVSEFDHVEPNIAEAFTVTPLPETTLFSFAMFPHPRDDNGPPSLRPTKEQFKLITSSEAPHPTKLIELPEAFDEDYQEGPLGPPTRRDQNKQKFRLFTTEAPEPTPKLEDIVFKTKPSKTTTTTTPLVQSLPPPKHRQPIVATEGWQTMDGPHDNSPATHFHPPRNPPRQFRQPDPDNATAMMTPTDHEMKKINLDYSRENRERMPIRVEMPKARDVIRDECSRDRQCGDFYKCCEKRWCDLSRECGTAKFCLPNCQTTKMTYLSSSGLNGTPLIDLVYD